jgi:CheY-like chemotaxis protein
MLRVLIIEDTIERQEILRKLFRENAWILANTAGRAATLAQAYDFDVICIDYDLDGEAKGSEVARAVAGGRNAKAKVFIHSMNPEGWKEIREHLPEARILPVSRMTENSRIFKRLPAELFRGPDFDWSSAEIEP